MRESDRRIQSRRLLGFVRSVRRRWRLRIALQGLTWTGLTVIAALVAVSLLLEQARFSADAILVGRVAAWGALALAVGWFLVRPLLRRVDDRRAALYLDENEPSLRHVVTTAVAGEVGGSPALRDRTVQDALSRLRKVEGGRRVERSALVRFGLLLGAVAVLGLLLVPFGPDLVRTGASALLPNKSAEEAQPYSVAVLPGDTTVARHSDLLLEAAPGGFEGGDAFLFARAESEESFTRLGMLEDGAGAFTAMLFELAEPTEYFVDISGVTSPTYSIEVKDLPRVERLDLVLNHPAYAGLDPVVIEDGGDVAALPGTVVEVTAHANMASEGGRIVLDGGPTSELAVLESSETPALAGRFTVTESGYYRVDLATEDGQLIPASAEYAITALSDYPPQVRFSRPGRDVPASPIEEVYLEAQAFDDYGVRELLLVSSVNGGPEDTVRIYDDRAGDLDEVSAGHTLFLEEWTLEPGDLVSYYALARDRRPGSEPVASDMFFVRVRPFDVAFRQAEQQGGGQQQGGRQAGPESALSELQRQVISATFNLIRQRSSYSEDEFDENVVSVALAQGRLREQVGTLLQRMENRGMTETDPGFRDVSAILPRAIEAMTEAKAHLDEGELQEAIGPEQNALRYLQQAEETYERYVSQGQEQQQGGGGGGSRQAAEDLADLFELELDNFANQYETVQRGQQQSADNEVDELIEKLNELARRQEQEAERQARRSTNAGARGSEAQRRLADETEETARQLERLAREMNDPDLEETARGLREAAASMRRAGAQAAGSDQANSALRRLRDAQREMEEARAGRAQRDAEAAASRVEELQRQQREVLNRVREMPRDLGEERAREIDDLRERKNQMTEAVQGLESALDRAAAGNRAENPEAARALQESANHIRESKLKEKLQYSRGTIEQWDPESAATLEMDIESDLQALRDQLQRAAEAAPQEEAGEGLERALEETRDLVRGLESMGRRLNEPADPQAEASGEGGEGEAGREEGGEGERGEGEGGRQERGGDPQGDPANSRAQGDPGARTAVDGSTYGGGLVRPRELTPEEVRQSGRQFMRDTDRVREIRNQLRMEGRPAEELEDVMEAMSRLGRENTYEDPALVARLHADVLEALRRLEFGLRREVEGGDERGAALTAADEVPEGYRELVEEYYRALARGGRAAGGRSPGDGP